MSLSAMISAASKTMGSADALFKNPAKDALDSLATTSAGLGVLGSSMSLADPTFDPSILTGQITLASADITSDLTAKVASLGAELPLVTAAAKQESTIQSVDAVLSRTAGDMPNLVNASFPSAGTCPSDTITEAFKPLTESNSKITAKVDEMTAQFDSSGPLAPLYTALNSIPTVSLSNGKELLAFLGNIPGALVPAVTSAMNGVMLATPALVSGLKSSFTSSIATTTAMSSEFSTMMSDSAAAVQKAAATITNSNMLNMINSPNTCIQKVMQSVVDPAAVDQSALVMAAAVEKKDITLPGAEAVTVAATPSTTTPELTILPPSPGTVPAAEIITPTPGTPVIDLYTKAEYSAMIDIVSNQTSVVTAAKKAAATWWKTNMEDWKVSVRYEAKKKAAGATLAALYGTSTDPVALAEWKAVYDGNPAPDNFLYKRSFYLTTYNEPLIAAETLQKQMSTEYNSRGRYGKYPYTYRAAQGVTVPESEQYTHLSPTK